MVMRRGLGISGLTQVITFVLGFASVVIVSRLLAPEDIGLFSVAVSILGLAHIVREFGVGVYLIQAKTVGVGELRAAFTVAVMTSWAIATLIFLIHWPMEIMYGHEGIGEILILLSLNFVLLPFGTPALALLRRDLQFRKSAVITIVASCCQTAVTITAAYSGHRYLSMAYGSLAATLVTMVMANISRPGATFLRPTFSGLGDVLRFGSKASATSVANELGRMAPDLILGKTLGFGDVAFFSRGLGLQRMIIEKIILVIRPVYLPFFSSNLRKGADPATLYLRSTNYVFAITGPILATLAVLAEPLILYIFGPQWQRSVQIAMVICTASIITAPYALYGSSLAASGKIGYALKTEIFSQIVRVVILLTSIWLNLEQVTFLLILAYISDAIFAQTALRKAFGFTGSMMLKGIWRTFLLVPFSVIGPLLVLTIASKYFSSAANQGVVLLSALLFGAFGWLVGIVVLRHPLQDELRLLLRKLHTF